MQPKRSSLTLPAIGSEIQIPLQGYLGVIALLAILTFILAVVPIFSSLSLRAILLGTAGAIVFTFFTPALPKLHTFKDFKVGVLFLLFFSFALALGAGFLLQESFWRLWTIESLQSRDQILRILHQLDALIGLSSSGVLVLVALFKLLETNWSIHTLPPTHGYPHTIQALESIDIKRFHNQNQKS